MGPMMRSLWPVRVLLKSMIEAVCVKDPNKYIKESCPRMWCGLRCDGNAFLFSFSSP